MDILIVDDDGANRKLLNKLLTELDYNVIEADCGEAAINAFKQYDPGVILMDIMMPGIDGYDTARKIKELSSEIYTPLIYVTALSPDEAIVEAVDAGGDAFVTKPINFKILVSKINAHLRIKKESIKLADANKKLKEHNQRMIRENELVEHIFNNALNKSFIDERFIRIYVSPFSAFSGDILLTEKKPNGNICVLLGDFTGHGLSAAIGSLPVVKVFFTMVKKGLSIKEIVKEINATIKMLLPVNMFLCASFVELDSDSGNALVWSGGLPPLILFDENAKEIKKIKGNHMPLGILDCEDFNTDIMEINIMKQQRLYLFTDGVTEARNAEGEMYGDERLDMVLKSSKINLFDALVSNHVNFLGNAEKNDDMTLVELKVDQLPL